MTDYALVRKHRLHVATGYSLLEMVVAMAGAAVLVTGLASALFMSVQVFDRAPTTADRASAAQVQSDMLLDLQQATSFSTRTADQITFNVPDRDGDDDEETITYAWDSMAKEVTYSSNGSPAAVLLTDVSDFQLGYLSRFMIGGAPTPPLVDPLQWGMRWQSPTANFGYETQFGTAVSNRRTQIATKVTLVEDGTLQSITAYLDNPGGDDYIFAIYDHDSGSNRPGNLLGQTSIGDEIGSGWFSKSTAPLVLSAGTYWLALSYENDLTHHREEPGGESEWRSGRATKNGFTSDWKNPTNDYNAKISIYATYEPSGS